MEPWRNNGANWRKASSLEQAKEIYRSKIAEGVVRVLPIPTGPFPVSQRERQAFPEDERHGYLVLVGTRTGVCSTR